MPSSSPTSGSHDTPASVSRICRVRSWPSSGLIGGLDNRLRAAISAAVSEATAFHRKCPTPPPGVAVWWHSHRAISATMRQQPLNCRDVEIRTQGGFYLLSLSRGVQPEQLLRRVELPHRLVELLQRRTVLREVPGTLRITHRTHR
jgi:hypothetical protein